MKELNLIQELNNRLVIAIHCVDMQQAENVLSFAAELGYKSDAIQSPLNLKNKWNEYKSNTIYFLNSMYKNVVYGNLNAATNLGYTIFKPSDFEELVNRDLVNRMADFLNCNPQARTELQKTLDNLVDKYSGDKLTQLIENLSSRLEQFNLQAEPYAGNTMLSIWDNNEKLSIEIELESGFINFNVYAPTDIEIIQIVLDFQKQLIELN